MQKRKKNIIVAMLSIINSATSIPSEMICWIFFIPLLFCFGPDFNTIRVMMKSENIVEDLIVQCGFTLKLFFQKVLWN